MLCKFIFCKWTIRGYLQGLINRLIVHLWVSVDYLEHKHVKYMLPASDKRALLTYWRFVSYTLLSWASGMHLTDLCSKQSRMMFAFLTTMAIWDVISFKHSCCSRFWLRVFNLWMPQSTTRACRVGFRDIVHNYIDCMRGHGSKGSEAEGHSMVFLDYWGCIIKPWPEWNAVNILFYIMNLKIFDICLVESRLPFSVRFL